MEWMILWMTFRGEWHLELSVDQSTLASASMRGDTPPSLSHTTTKQKYTHTKQGQDHTRTHSSAAWSYSQSLNIKHEQIHLGFVALLRTQSRSRSVKLLGHDTQKLSLVLCSIAVRRADVHHLEKDGDADAERYIQKREGQRDRVSVGKNQRSQQREQKARGGKWLREPRSQTTMRKDSCAHAWCRGQPAVTQWTQQEASFTGGSSKTTVGQLLQEIVCKS